MRIDSTANSDQDTPPRCPNEPRTIFPRLIILYHSASQLISLRMPDHRVSPLFSQARRNQSTPAVCTPNFPRPTASMFPSTRGASYAADGCESCNYGRRNALRRRAFGERKKPRENSAESGKSVSCEIRAGAARW